MDKIKAVNLNQNLDLQLQIYACRPQIRKYTSRSAIDLCNRQVDKTNNTRLPFKIGSIDVHRDFIKYVQKIRSLTTIFFLKIIFISVNNNLLYFLSKYTVHTPLYLSIVSISRTRVLLGTTTSSTKFSTRTAVCVHTQLQYPSLAVRPY